MRHLFVDDVEIAHMKGLTRVLHPGTLYDGNPVLGNDHPWERYIIKSGGTCLFHDPVDGLYKLYYLVIPRVVTSKAIHINGKRLPPHSTQVCYATSPDMIHWDKPMLGQCTFDDEADSNLLAIGDENPEGQAILYDPHDPDPARRYKALFWDHRVEPPAEPPPGGRAVIRRVGEGARHAYDVIVEDAEGNAIWKRSKSRRDGRGGMWASFSPDGVRWTPHETNPLFLCGNDTTTSVHYDEYLKRYVAFGRFNATAIGHGQAFGISRNIARIESEDFIHWSEPEPALCVGVPPDDPDLQLDCMAVAYYEGMYLGLMCVDLRPKILPLELACSRDTVRWERICPGEPFISHPPPGEWGSGQIWATGALIPVGDRVYNIHDVNRNHEGLARRLYDDIADMDPEEMMDLVQCRLGLSWWRRDGFVSLDAGPDGGELITRPFKMLKPGEDAEIPRIQVNVDATGGELVASLCDLRGVPVPGYEQSLPVRGDQLEAVLRWPNVDPEIVASAKGDILEQHHPQYGEERSQEREGDTWPPLTVFRLHLRLTHAKLFSFWFDS